jgi:hypothetical protein
MKRKTGRQTERRHSGNSSDSYSGGILFEFTSEIVITDENNFDFTWPLEANTEKELKKETTAAFHILPNSSFTNHSTI